MDGQQLIKGFSRLSREEKVKWLSAYLEEDALADFLAAFRMDAVQLQDTFEGFSENTLSNFHLPWGIVPNVLIDGKLFHVPVVIEESSVVAAASKAASFWAQRGGFKTLQLSTLKKGQLHFLFYGNPDLLNENRNEIYSHLAQGISHLTRNMEQRGGGVKAMELKQVEGLPAHYYQLELLADTRDSMGANFINSLLEEMGRILPDTIKSFQRDAEVDILMAILSNDTPDSMVKMQLSTPINLLTWQKDMEPIRFAERMQWAADIAWHDTARAVTHNKGIYNGVDAVVLATGNDFRAVEAAGHAHAARTGKYRALSRVFTDEKNFTLEMEIPLALGTVGGLTRLHPLAAKSLQVLGEPDAPTLMKIAAALGIANNFAAMASLVTTGIQKGHMKMHLKNILMSLDVPARFHDEILTYFNDKTVSVAAVREYAKKLTNG